MNEWVLINQTDLPKNESFEIINCEYPDVDMNYNENLILRNRLIICYKLLEYILFIPYIPYSTQFRIVYKIYKLYSKNNI